MIERIVKSTSFDDEYEFGLLDFATDPARGRRGKFGPFVKQLIAEAREREERGDSRWQPHLKPTSVVADTDDDLEAAKGYL